MKIGLSFGTTSGVVTTLGLMVGLNATTHSKLVVIGGILIIAIADALSDAFGIHMSEESENKHTSRQIWESSIFTFLAKFIVASTFIIPLLVCELHTAVLVSIAWGLVLLVALNFFIARMQKIGPFKIISMHLLIAVVVIIATHLIGSWISKVFV